MKGRNDTVRGEFAIVVGNQKKVTELTRKRPIQHLIAVKHKVRATTNATNGAVSIHLSDRRTIWRPVGEGPPETSRNLRGRTTRQAAVTGDFNIRRFY